MRANLIGIVANSVSGPVAFDDSSPQGKALDWIVNLDPNYACPEDPGLRSRYAMAVLYYSTGGDRWTSCNAPNSGDAASQAVANANCPGGNAWLTGGSVCDWNFVSCDARNNVIEIDIGACALISPYFKLHATLLTSDHSHNTDSNGLTGTLIVELQELQSLRQLKLQNGAIFGTIPDIFDSMTELEILDLDFNFIGGELPRSIYQLRNLVQLDLNHNRLQGTISRNIGQLEQLKLLSLDNNRMSGQIPDEIGTLLLLGMLLVVRSA